MKELITLLLILCTATGYTRDLDLSEAIEMAQDHSHRLKQAQALAESAQSALMSAEADRLPVLSVSAMASYISEIPTLDIEVAPGISFSRDVGTDDNYQTDLRLTLPIYTGGRISGNISVARSARKYYEALRQADTYQVSYLARVYYLRLLRSDRTLDAAKASLTRVQVIMDDIQSLHAAGAADSVDLLEASLAVTNAEFAVSSALTNRRSAEITMATLVGIDPSESIVLTTELKIPQNMELSAEVSQAKPELVAAKAQVGISRSTVRLAQASHYPTLSAYGGYSYGMPNIDRFNNTWNDYFTAGVVLDWSFSVGGKTRKDVQTAKHRLSHAEHQHNQIAEDFSREARIAVENLKLALTRYNDTRREFEITEDNYRLAMQKHFEGVLSSNRRLEIETSLTAAQAAVASSLVDYHIAYTNWVLVTSPEKLRESI